MLETGNDQFLDLVFYSPEVGLDDFGGYGTHFRKRLPGSFSLFDGLVIDKDMGMKDFELDGLGGAVGGYTDEILSA